MISKAQIRVFYLLTVLFIFANCYLIATRETLLLNLIPVAIISLFALFLSMDKVLLFSVFLVPFSIPLKTFFPSLDFNLDIPTEPIFLCLVFLFLLKQLKDRDFDSKILKHPVSLCILFYLGWRLITVFTSTIPIVSVKYFSMQIWLIVPFYFIMTQIVRKKKNINIFFWAYIISLCIVITYTLIVHSTHGFSQGHANLAMRPFYNDHTSYGAALAMFIPIVAGFIVNKENKKSYRVISGFVFTYLIIAIIFSYTRAAWVSLLVSFALWLMLKLKINYKIVLTTVIILIGTFFAFQEQILLKLEGNKQDSSTDFSEHIRSITNVATDASNMERINRWNSAVRMYKEKPVFGWGPGTYQFNYAPFQYSYEKTIISTNAGNMGNAHSEYLGALSESGFLGMISFVLILIYVFITSVKVYNKATSKSLKILIASIICGLITYYAHGFLNNFLDIDKIAVPFLGFIAIIVAADVYFKDFDTQNINNEKKI